MIELLGELLTLSSKVIDLAREVARFDEEELTREVGEEELFELYVELRRLRERAKSLGGEGFSAEGFVVKLSEQVRDVEQEWAARKGEMVLEEAERAEEVDAEEDESGVCSRCGVPDGAYDSFCAGACNCSE